MTSQLRRAAKYKRISKDREGRELGVGRQDKDLDHLGERRGLLFVADFTDNDLGASPKSKKRRPRYEAMLAAAKAGEFEVIASYTQGRITRRPREFEDLIDLAVDHGIEFEYIRSPSFDLRTAQGREVARTLAARDAGEAEELSERVTREKKEAAAEGRWRGGRRPYGYQADGVTLEPAEAEHVAYATREVLLGASLRSLAVELNSRGAVTSTGRGWSATELRRVLLRARNAGLVEAGGEIVGKAVWPAIVTRAEWEAASRVLRDPSRRTNQTNSARKWLLAGLGLCGVCADGTTVRCTSGGGKRLHGAPDYSCSSGIKHLTRRASYVDEVVKAAVLGWISRPEVRRQLVVRADVDTDALDAREREINNQLDECEEMYAARVWTRQRVERIAAKLNAELAEIQEQRVQAAAGHPAGELLAADDIEAAWEALDVSRRQAIVDSVCVVTLLPAMKGRPAGWRAGERYFDPRTVKIEWR